jgi:hypothetical protein
MPAGVWLLVSACGPGVATPMPEPPVAFDLGGVNNAEVTITHPTEPDAVSIPASAGTVPAGAVVRITNLDRITEVTAVNATAQGSFEAVVFVSDGQELRFEWVNGGKRSAPADAIFVRPDPTAENFQLVASPRFACVKLSPGYALDFGTKTAAVLGVENDCDEPITLGNTRLRIGLADFEPAPNPPEVPPGESAEITVNFQRSVAGLREDVLLVDVTLGAETIRYPITLRAD